MNNLFERVPLHESPLIWKYRHCNTADFSGYYHWHQCCEILLVHEGRGSVIFNQKMYPLRTGMLFFFQPFQLHKVHAEVGPQTPYVRSGLHFDPYAFDEALRQFPALHTWFTQLWQGADLELAFDVAPVMDYLDQVLAMYARIGQQPLEAAGKPKEDSAFLLLQMLHGLSLAGPSRWLGIVQPRQLSYSEQIMHYIEDHYAEEIRLEDIAEALHLSKFYLSRLFQTETGSSIMHYMTARRIKAACRLLQTTPLSVEQIGGRVGVPNPSYFIRLFKKEVGLTPLKYRHRM
ncbi:AraC family transcriptional regulator [Paenibacillus sp. MMS20-IR301]|uniref:AraC family transcriptional regulator n=1 Tax=Paenibacillus sp. MMS20-IR301 TaxID=2895946 RepID=UPI0028EE30CC|nr:AraC family transcriptional regulator [Paenibacillus sp. MMS20-IR301]WNS43105.1 AraC family transcriptional regulator [Paenibacillus sp. MMS20-IR301]